jgi:cytidylate kinase
MAVITISRETGSGGYSIAEQVARALQYKLVGKDLIGRVLSQYGADGNTSPSGYFPDFWTRFEQPINEQREFMVETLNRVILALAHQDDMVIVGRSGFAILAVFEDVLNVRIQAPLAIRIQRVMDRRRISKPARAEALVRESDRVRAAFIDGFYGSRWDSARGFDVVIDTGKVSEKLATDWLIQAVKGLQEQFAPGGHTVDTIYVDPILTTLVTNELQSKVLHG